MKTEEARDIKVTRKQTKTKQNKTNKKTNKTKKKKKKAHTNPLNPKSDQHLISSYSNTSELIIKIMRIKEIIANLGCFDCWTNSPR